MRHLVICISIFSSIAYSLPSNFLPHDGKSPNNHNSSSFQISAQDEGLGNFVAKRGSDVPRYKLQSRQVSLPQPLDKVTQFSGYLSREGEKSENDQNLFYWFFESRSDPTKDPIILWLNGGPGSSSLIPIFGPLGPSKMTKEGTLKPNKLSWNSKASVIFLDQPVNVGYSYGKKKVDTTADATKDTYAFLQLFFNKYPKYANLPFHIHGISYGGHYVPALANMIVTHEQQGPKDTKINLKSISIANGWTNPLLQYGSFHTMVCDKGAGDYPALLNQEQCTKLKADTSKCEGYVQACYDTKKRAECQQATSFCESNLLSVPITMAGHNQYDIRPAKTSVFDKIKGKVSRRATGEKVLSNGKSTAKPSVSSDAMVNVQCPLLDSGLSSSDNSKIISNIESFLKFEPVKTALGVKTQEYRGCTSKMVTQAFAFTGDYAMPFHDQIPAVLAKKVSVLVYAGDADYAANWVGNKKWTDELVWDGKNDYKNAAYGEWKVKGKKAGMIKSAKGLTFVKVAQAGHTAEVSQPDAVMELLQTYVGKSAT
ncbi:hypothetical protein AA313_de0209348 [Arthrobotrys entomopaga]|nr:hypothetical protein AA313_de0209348 [Arthrobotrys entomopaga]